MQNPIFGSKPGVFDVQGPKRRKNVKILKVYSYWPLEGYRAGLWEHSSRKSYIQIQRSKGGYMISRLFVTILSSDFREICPVVLQWQV